MNLPRNVGRRLRLAHPAVFLACLSFGLAVAPGAFSQTNPKQPPAAAGSAKPAGSAAPSASSSASPSASAAGPAASGSAAPSSAAPAGSAAPPATASSDPVPDVQLPPIVERKQAPPPPTPNAEQLAGLQELEKEADVYEKAARDYRRAITGIVQHHYEDRRRRILSALDNEISIEKKGQRDAREEAIRRLEAFVAKYSGANAHPESTPDAMFRLAALYEDRARTDTDSAEELAQGLRPAIALYKRIIKEYPQYKELAGIYYYLGHAYNDSARLAEAQQVWRSLVCHNGYGYPTAADSKDPEKDVVTRLPQDHDRDYWTGWEARHPTPPSIVSGTGTKGRGGKPIAAPPPPRKKRREAAGATTSLDDEVSFRNPYGESCKPIPQKTAPGTEPRYLAEVWWLIGDYHFNEVDPAGGPFNYNRAEAAYQQSIKFKKPPVHGVAMYKLAWTYFKQQRYETSVREFVDLLRYADQQEKATGDAGADFRSEAYTYIAGSLTYLDFAGPGLDDPYIPRNDVLDIETDSRIAEQKMRIAIDRVQDERLIPQKEKWTVDIYKALAQEYKELNQLHNNVEVDELILKKWPMNRDAPVVQNEIADIYDKLTFGSRDGTAERKENASKALAARTKLSAYVGATPWTDANKNDPEALQTADRLVRGGLRRAAADHTNAGSGLIQQAVGMGDRESRDPVLERALTEYKLAAQGWEGYLRQDVNAPDAYESRYWLADANHNVVVILVLLDRSPAPNEIDAARRSAVDVRDSNEDDKYLQPAAFFVVDTARQVLEDQFKLRKRSGGAQGLEKRDAVRTTGEGENTRAVKDAVPAPVLALVTARDEYIQRVPRAADLALSSKQGVGKNADLFAFQSADDFYLYGQFDEARKRFQPIYDAECGKSQWGFKAWGRLKDMAILEGNIEASRKLAEAAQKKSCALTAADKKDEAEGSSRIIAGGYYIDAYRAFQKAEKMSDGPERVKQWRDAGQLYQVALKNAPGRDEAPEAAMNGALAFKQIGDYDQAIDMYTLFIKEYGSEENLRKLEKGDSSVTPPKPADPKQYGERVKRLKEAYDALAAAYVLFFNYRSAAESYDTISRNVRFEKTARRDAAQNAVVLYANIGDGGKMSAARSTFMSLDPPAEKRAEIDYLVASADLKAWDENGLDEGTNRGERLKAITSMDAYYSQNKAKNEAAQFVVMAAYNSAKLRKAGKDGHAVEWCKNTISAFEKFRGTSKIVDGRSAAFGSLQADMAAECAFGPIDEKIRAEFDYSTGHHRYAGVIDKVKKAYDDDVKKAESYFNQLQEVINKFESRPWSVAAKARQGSLYDSCRTGLFNTRAPGLKLYNDKEEKLLKAAESSGREDLLEKADEVRTKRTNDWRSARERSLNDADKAMVKFYTEAVVYGRAFKVRNAAVDMAIQRLAFFTNILGDAKLREYSQGVIDPETKSPFQYTDGVFLRTRPGMAPALKSDELPAPLPVVP